jgi:hypothetical protein
MPRRMTNLRMRAAEPRVRLMAEPGSDPGARTACGPRCGPVRKVGCSLDRPVWRTSTHAERFAGVRKPIVR